MDTQTQIDRLIELAIIQRSELKQLVEQLPQLREHLNAEVEKVFDETEPQLRAELEEWTTKQTADKTAALGVALEAKIADLAKSLEVSTQARYNAIIAERAENARLAAQAEAKIAEHAASLPSAVKEIVSAELARFPRAGEIDQLRKEFAEPRGLNPRGKWQAGETYNKLDLVTINGDSYTSNTDGNRTRPSRSSADWTLVAARGTGGGGGPTSLSELTTVPSDGDLLIGSGTSWVTSNLTAGAGISITVGPGAITISATDGDITLDDGTAASPSLHFTNDPDTGIYRPAANTLGISTSGVQRMYVDQNGITTVGAGGTFDGSVHAANGNANNPSFSFSGDQDTGFFHHQPNEIGIALGGTQYATLTSTTFSITPVVTMASSLRVNGTTDSSSKDTGAIVTEGGLGVEKSATIGGNLAVSGTANVGNLLTVTGSGTETGVATAKVGASALGGIPRVNLINATNAVNGKYGDIINTAASGNGAFQFRFIDDAITAATAVLSITGRQGATDSFVTAPGTGAHTFGTTNTVTMTNGVLATTGAGTIGGNLTVSGGTIGTAASTNLTLAGGSSGASLALGQGTNGTFTFTLPSISAGNTTWVSAGAVGIGIDFKRATAAATLGVTLASLNGYNGATRAAIFEFNGDGATDSGRFDWWVKPTAGSLTQAMVLKSNGNLLIGTTTDGGQKLQVNGNSGFLGHLEIPADKHIYMKQGNPLRWSSDGLSTGTVRADIYADSGGILYFRTNGTTAALNIDASQNATFAGRVISNGTGYGVGANSDANTPFNALTSINGTFGALIRNTNAGSSAFAGINIEADSGQAGFRQYSTAHSVWAGKTLISAPSGGTGLVLLTNGAGDAIDFWTNATQALSIDASQNIVPGTAALATTATNGFIYLQTCAGAPTGVPTSYTGRVASIYDTTNNKLYIYNGGWKSVTLA